MSRSISSPVRRQTMLRVSMLTGAVALVATAGTGWFASASGDPMPASCPPHTLELWPSFTLPPLAEGKVVTPGTVLDGTTHRDITTQPTGWGSVPASALRIEWQRDGIPRGGGDTYEVGVRDIGHTVTQVAAVQSTDVCRRQTVLASAPTVRVAAPTEVAVKQVRPGLLRVRVDQVGGAPPTGFVRVRWTGTRRGSDVVELRRSAEGRVNVRMPMGRPGKYAVTASFVDTSGTALDSRNSRLFPAP
ncbi:hypothetical protein EXE58_07445 [Nocardioides seonyuensis]|uniref:Bacterial Ig-like domain-containing protein n=1 Tax=Nocardioides seonyuensis TaxID=2518371 RepID=A0A4P7IDP2_9ACTN|nr:hypothetical protein [Nocardioides seonyuensis]QBX55304.1 hypothetical protein EXE58_07445 [Nocardioides seonyuensis]